MSLDESKDNKVKILHAHFLPTTYPARQASLLLLPTLNLSGFV